MSDYGHRETDRRLAELESRVSSVYKDASDDMTQTVRDYFAQFADRDAEQKAALEAGDISKQEYTQWRLTQIGRGERYQAMRDKLAERYTDANEVAISYVNDATPGIYSLNRNYSAYTIEQSSADVDFILYDEQTVRRLIVEQPNLMPNYPEAKAVARGIDLAYGKEQITASVTSGILQGSSVYKIADDLMKRITTMSETSAIRTARTAFTEAENAGRQDSYEAAEAMGIPMQKRWVATLDSRTRETHIEADGQTVGVDDNFKVGDGELEYPGDSDGEPAEVYNCRCTVIAVVDGVDYKDGERRGEGERFEAWMEEKEKEQAEASKLETIGRDYECDLAQSLGKENYDMLCDMVDGCGDDSLKALWYEYQSDIKVGDAHFKGTAYEQGGAIYFNLNEAAAGSSYQTPMQVVFHESCHAIDYLASEEGMYSVSYSDGVLGKALVAEVNGLVNNYATVIKQDFKDHAGDWDYLTDKGYISLRDFAQYVRYGSWTNGEPKYSKSLAYDALSKELRQIDLISRGNFSDIVDGVTRGKANGGVGHPKSYWAKDNVASVTEEAFAEMSDATFANPDSLNVLKEYLPESYEVWHNMITGMTTAKG